jgi:hypothetical protein
VVAGAGQRRLKMAPKNFAFTCWVPGSWQATSQLYY